MDVANGDCSLLFPVSHCEFSRTSNPFTLRQIEAMMAMKAKIQTPSIGNATSKSRLFTATCHIFGLDLRETANSRFSTVVSIVYLVVTILSIYPTLYEILHIYGHHMSPAFFAWNNQTFLSYVIMFLTVRLIGPRRVNLLQLLGGPQRRHSFSTAAVLMFNIPIIYLYVTLVISDFRSRDFTTVMNHVCYLHRELVQNFFIILHLEALRALEGRCRILLAGLAVRHVKPAEVVREKLRIRNVVAKLNDSFATVLAILYGQLFMNSVTLFILVITGTAPLQTKLYTAYVVCLTCAVFMMANKSSTVIELLVDVEHRTIQRFITIDGFAAGLPAVSFFQWEVLRFSIESDTPQIGCLVHDKATFVSLMASFVTCLAVILQFDFKVVRTINDLAEEYGESEIEVAS